MMQFQVVQIPKDGEPTVFFGDPDCDRDPCDKHNRCHCMCPCGCYDPGDDRYDDCDSCAEIFGED